MDFLYSDEQQMLRDSVDRYGEEMWPPADRLKRLARDAEADKREWAAMAELGWLMLAIPEDAGGMGGGPADVMAVMEGFGRHLIVAPYVASCILAPALLAGGGDAAADLLERIGSGGAIVAAGLLEADGGDDLHRVATRAERTAGGWRMAGAKVHVEDGGDADHVLVSARVAGAVDECDGIGLFLLACDTPGLTVERFRAIDGHRHVRLRLDGAMAVAIGEPEHALPRIEAAVDRARAAHLAEATGSAEAAAAATLDHIKTRHQFGVPIGSFQVLQHRMADMTIACEEARAMTYHATLSLDRDPRERARAVSAGKVRVGESGLYVGQQAVQLHGGVGFSDELIVSHHLRRQMMLAGAYGGIDHHRARFAARLPEDVHEPARAARPGGHSRLPPPLLPRDRPCRRSRPAVGLLARRHRLPRRLFGQRIGVRRLGLVGASGDGAQYPPDPQRADRLSGGGRGGRELFLGVPAPAGSGRAAAMGPEGALSRLVHSARGEWALLNRTVVFDWVEAMPLPPGTEAERFGKRLPVGGKAPDDPLYRLLA